jgi:hypothetical protein
VTRLEGGPGSASGGATFDATDASEEGLRIAKHDAAEVLHSVFRKPRQEHHDRRRNIALDVLVVGASLVGKEDASSAVYGRPERFTESLERAGLEGVRLAVAIDASVDDDRAGLCRGRQLGSVHRMPSFYVSGRPLQRSKGRGNERG